MQPTPISQYVQLLKGSYIKIDAQWNNEIIPLLKQFIEIPNKSPMFDRQWKPHGYMDQAVQLLVSWCRQQPIRNMRLEVIEDEGRTPLIFIDIPGNNEDNIFIYGHLDKQPEMEGWDEDKGPWKAVLQDGKLYGRGGADDGYAVFAALMAINTLQQQGISHSRCVVIIEASEESGSPDLVHYLNQLKPKIGCPSLIIGLDSGCGNYDQLWNTNSLRGLVNGDLTIRVLKEGIHSGIASGIVPSAWTILRQLLERLENSTTGQIVPDFLYSDISLENRKQAQQMADILGEEMVNAYALIGHTRPVCHDLTELLLNNWWRPQLSITSIDGAPSIEQGGSVTLPYLKTRLSLRLPPTQDANHVGPQLKDLLEANPPFGADVHFSCKDYSSGWSAPEMAPWLEEACQTASQTFFGRPLASMGIGGSIPFMGMLGDLYPEAQFLITGVLGPHSNAHGPNEFLHLSMAKKVTACVASVIASHFVR